MIIRTIVDEDFVQYKEPCMYIGTAFCNGKCCKEANIPLSICINDAWRETATIDTADNQIIERYISNNITKAICFAGLEPFEQFEQMYSFIEKVRKEYSCDDMILIYTGYYEKEIAEQVEKLKEFKNIIIKFGRFVPNQEPHYDETIGVMLASDNQYAKKIC